MPIIYSHPQTDADLYAGQMRTTKAQLDKINRELCAVQAEQERSPYSWEWRAKLPALTQLKHRLESQLRSQEMGLRAAGGAPDAGPRALTSGSFWLPADS
jgi:hypothetical protein